ncbi:acyltransferase [Siculibacillus lacustris]|uniref:Acyltransferase n=1 Tax=Siculibacillus lacustris TaxID=1549641 RepID=A0A4Q9VPV0_9HYPH|nr:acyltransferase family protein [Siculibacillus lacustris]TBW37659.1 acyltransferase [Siculibacillus lacustris]
MSTPADRGWRADIDGLRAVSVVVVILFHLGTGLMPGGYVGVDSFFVISGFLITGIIAREADEGRFSFLRFYERRIRRIYPALIVVLAATFAAAWVIQMPRDFLGFSRTLIAAPLFASNFMFLGADGYFDPTSITKPLLHTWSLGVEEQFYIVLPWLILGLGRVSAATRVRGVALVVAASLAASIASAAVGFDKAYYLLPMRFWELGFGALIALARPQLGPGARAIASVGGLALLIGGCLGLDAATPFPGWAALLPVVGACGILLGEGGPANRLLATWPFVFVGRISYPMYLWHWPPIVFTLYVTGRPIDPPTAAALFALVVVLSTATLHLVETPIRSRRWLSARTRLFGVSAVASAILVALGIVAFATDGWPSRLSPEVRRLAEVGLERTLLEDVCPHRRRDWAADLPPCVLGDASAPRFGFAILGDSHGRAIAGAIGEQAARLGIKGLWLGRVACAPLAGVERLGDASRRCAEHLDWALGRIREVDPKTVLVIGRWGSLVDRRAAAQERGAPPAYAVDGRPVPAAETEAAVTAGLGRTLDALGGRPVALLLSIPEPGFDVPTVGAASHLFGRTPPEGPSAAEWRARMAPVRAMLAPALARHPEIEVIDPALELCGSGRCAWGRDGAALFVDSDHPSRAGSRVIAPLFADFLAREAR